MCACCFFFFFSSANRAAAVLRLGSWRMVFAKGTFLQEYPPGSARLHCGDIWHKVAAVGWMRLNPA